MPGTPMRNVEGRCTSASRAAVSPNAGSRSTVPPTSSMCASWSQKPVLWKSGTITSVRSSSFVPIAQTYAVAADTSPSWVMTAPFGRPVLPEVKLISAWLEGVTAALTAPAERPAQTDSSPDSRPVSGSSVEPARRAPGVADSSSSSSQSTRRGCRSAICCSSSYGLRR